MKNFIYFLALGLLLVNCEQKKHESEKQESEKKASEDTTSTNNNINTVNKDSCAGGINIKYSHAYNNFIIDNQGYIVEKNIEFVKALQNHEPEKVLTEKYNALTTQTQNSIDSLEHLCTFNGNSEFKNSAVELFKFYQEAWKEYKGFVESKNKEERIKKYEEVSKRFNEVHSKTEKELEGKFNSAHLDFINKYNLHVRSTPMHQKMDSLLYPTKK